MMMKEESLVEEMDMVLNWLMYSVISLLWNVGILRIKESLR